MKRHSSPQLFAPLSNLELPDSVSGPPDSRTVNSEVIHRSAFVNWPSGRPCIPVNMYLLESAYKWTGDSAARCASDLTALLRYCARHGRRFAALSDSDIFLIVDELRSNVYIDDPTRRVRNDNTVRRILGASIEFLFWYQDQLQFTGSRLIGERGDAPSIVVVRKINARGHEYWWHRYFPEEESRDPKMPIGLSVIEGIEGVIDRLSDIKNYSEPAQRRFKNNSEFGGALLGYLHQRRTFMLWIMKRTGLRPQEMTDMSAKENFASIATKALTLPTMKRRKLMPPPRTFPISAKDARVVFRYRMARDRWMDVCASRTEGYVRTDAMFLSVAPGDWGEPVAKSGLEKDFQRLCALAGYGDQQACFSMFRHRFITYEVLSHLKEWEAQKGPVVSSEDYRAILERVRVKTGHKNVDSLWHYIDFARDLEGVWGNIDRAVGRLHAADHLKLDLENLREEMRKVNGRRMAAEHIVELVLNRLDLIIQDAHDAGIR